MVIIIGTFIVKLKNVLYIGSTFINKSYSQWNIFTYMLNYIPNQGGKLAKSAGLVYKNYRVTGKFYFNKT